MGIFELHDRHLGCGTLPLRPDVGIVERRGLTG